MRFPHPVPIRLHTLMLCGGTACGLQASANSRPALRTLGTAPDAVAVDPTINRVRASSRTVPLDAARCRDLAGYFDAAREIASVRASWTWTTTARTGGDRVEVTVDPGYTLTMPRWGALSSRPLPERAAWDRVYRALTTHEDGHIDIFLKRLKWLRGDLASIRRPTVPAALSEIEQRLAAFKRDLNTRQDEYDRHTRHGIAQGATLQCP